MKDDQVYFKKRCKLCSSVATSSFSCYLRLFNFLLLITTKNISFLFNYCLLWIDHWVCTVPSRRKVKSLLLTDIIRFPILMLLVLILKYIFHMIFLSGQAFHFGIFKLSHIYLQYIAQTAQ